MRYMDRDSQDRRIGRPTFARLALLVVAFMALSLLVTATGTARFAVAMGYDRRCRLRGRRPLRHRARAFFLFALVSLVAARACSAGLLGIAWVCLVAFSCLATHATVSTAISSIERIGTWKMEVRGNTKAELATVEQQLAALSRPATPRPCQDGARGAGSGARASQRLAGQPGVRATSRRAPISPGHARRSYSCAASWRRLRTTSACQRGPPSCARASRRHRSWPPRIPCPRRSAPPWAAWCRSAARKVWRCF